jgi:hypothetical protein
MSHGEQIVLDSLDERIELGQRDDLDVCIVKKSNGLEIHKLIEQTPAKYRPVIRTAVFVGYGLVNCSA